MKYLFSNDLLKYPRFCKKDVCSSLIVNRLLPCKPARGSHLPGAGPS